ncbi:MAG: hypothetical protein ABSD75_24295 [Terriglobales bacterium]
MPRMIDLIRNSQVPANLMQSAVRGALSVPPEETIEILVYLALHHKMFSEQARLTLAAWDEKASLAAAADPKSSREVLGYLVSPENLRPVLLPALAENPSISEEALATLAASGSRPVVEALWRSPRARSSPPLLQALQANPNLRQAELAEIGNRLAGFEAGRAVGQAEGDEPDEIVEEAVNKYLHENATELAAEHEKPFQAIEVAHEDGGGVVAHDREPPLAASPVNASAAAAAAQPAHATAHVGKHDVTGQERRGSSLQKIAKLNITGRIALAMRGSKEERSILIRDSTKLVALAVLDSPKVSDAEVEKIALQKNVLEAVLRAIPMKRKFAKNYTIMRNLVFNPRTPLDLSLGLMKNLLVHDLKNLSGNKEVSDTIRKLALRMFKQKVEKKG